MRNAIARLELDLRGLAVLTEAASGPFAVTPLIAGLAGASRVVALTADSPYARADAVKEYVSGWAADLAIADRIDIMTDRDAAARVQCNIVTNLGFVRPIDADIVDRLPADAVVALMWEPWEFRPNDIDVSACKRRDIPVIGTCETDARVDTFRYVGLIALKLLLQSEIEVYQSRILVLGEPPFLNHTRDVLADNGAVVSEIRMTHLDEEMRGRLRDELKNTDALVVVDHVSGLPVVGTDGVFMADQLRDAGVVVVHICGSVDDAALLKAGVAKVPSREVAPGFMTVTTDYVGPRPLIDLHAAGLKVGELIVRARRAGLSTREARRVAIDSGLALDLPAHLR